MGECPHTDDVFSSGVDSYSFSESDSASDSTSSTSFQPSGATLSPTSGADGRWEIHAQGTMVGDAGGGGGDIIDCEVVIDVDGTTYEVVTFAQYAAASGPHWAPFALHKFLDLTAGAHTVTLKFRTTGTYFSQAAKLQASHLTVKYPT